MGMSRRTRFSAAEQRRHDRSALLQWIGVGIVALLGLAAAFLLTDGDGGGSHLNAPPTAEMVPSL